MINVRRSRLVFGCEPSAHKTRHQEQSGYGACMAFAAALREGEICPEDWPPLWGEEFRYMLDGGALSKKSVMRACRARVLSTAASSQVTFQQNSGWVYSLIS